MTDRKNTELPGSVSGKAKRSARPGSSEPAARVFRLGGQWYFATRDGDIGPFHTREQAAREADAHRAVLKAP